MRAELPRVVDEGSERATGSERVVEWLRRRVEARRDVVVGLGELRGDAAAELLQRPQCLGRRAEDRRSELGVAERLAANRQLARVTGEEREERHAQAAESRRGAECELVGEHRVGCDRGDDAAKARSDGQRLPEQVVPATLGLVTERRDHPLAGCREERAQLGVRARRSHAAVAARAEGELDVLVPVGRDERSERPPGRHDDPVPAGAERAGRGRERVPVGRVVRNHDEDDHAATLADSPTTSWYTATSDVAIASIV